MSGSIGGVDASIPLQAGKGVAPVNPLAQIGEFANVQNALNTAKMFPGQLALQKQQQQSNAMNLIEQNNQGAAHFLSQFVTTPPKDINAFTDLAARAEAMGYSAAGLNHARQVAEANGVPLADAFQRWVVANAQPAHTAVNSVAPAQTTMNAGDVVLPIATPNPGTPGAGQPRQVAPGIAVGPSAEFWQAQIDRLVTTPEDAARYGVPIGTKIDEAAIARAKQQHSYTQPGTRIPAAGTSQPSAGIPGNGGYPGTAIVTAPSPTTMSTNAAQVAPAQAVADRVGHFQTDMFPLLQAQSELGKANTGKGSAAMHSISSYLNTFAPEQIQRGLSLISPIMNPEETTAYDLTKKYLAQGQLGVPGATRSNEGLATAGTASPSADITPEAAKLVVKGMIALRRMEHDEGQSWLSQGKGGQAPDASTFNDFRSNFAKTTNPSVYTFDMMSPAQRRDFLLKNPNAAALIQRAERNGVIQAPGAAQ
jgi:hypothetical protein